jgi:hypothetical protein
MRSRRQGSSAGPVIDRGDAGAAGDLYDADLYDAAQQHDDRRAPVTSSYARDLRLTVGSV